MDKFVKFLIGNTVLCLATGTMLAACGGGDAQSSADSATLLANGEACAAAWVSTTAYANAGTKVSRLGVNYTNNWWTQGEDPSTNNGGPGTGKPWTAGFTCGGTVTTTTNKATTTTSKTTTTTTAGSGLNPGLPPGDNFNLAGWQLQLPTGTPGNMDQVEGTQLEAGYTKKPYFYTDTSDGSMVLMDPAVGVASNGSLHPRTELREYAQWYTTKPSTLSATLKVTKVIGSTTIAQIFQGTGPLKPLCELQFSASSVHLFLENSNQGGQGGPTTVITTVPVGQKFSYKMTYVGNTITVTVNGVTKTFTSDPSFNGEKFFFKAGNYNQSATAGTPQTTDGTVVKFYSLSTTH